MIIRTQCNEWFVSQEELEHIMKDAKIMPSVLQVEVRTEFDIHKNEMKHAS